MGTSEIKRKNKAATYYKKLLKMPQLTNSLNGSLRKGINLNKYIYKTALPQKLRDNVSTRGDKNKSNPCLAEMAVMVSCWQTNEFNESLCNKEIMAFNNCMAQHKKDAELRQAAVNITGRLPSKELNKLLKRYPQPKS